MRAYALSACLLSGAAGLIYQVVWMRKLALVVGVTSLAVSAVLAVFMGGLALGSWTLGRMADRSRSPLKLYGALELGIAILGLLSPSLLDALVYARWPQAVVVPLSCLVIAAPTVLMGGTLPVLLRALTGGAKAGEDFGWLYAVNTLGGVAGTLAAAFYLVETSGLTGAARAAAACNAAAAALVLLPSWSLAARPPGHAGSAPAPRRRDIELTLAFAGFMALAAEVLWTRYLICAGMRNSVHAFSLMLAAFLTGIVLGSALAARALRALKDSAEEALGVALLLSGAACLATVPLLDYWTAQPQPAGGSFWWASSVRFARAFGILAVPAALSGMLFPLGVHAYARRAERLGEDAGRLYAANTLGAILGALGGGLIILPLLGLRGGIGLLSGMAMLGGTALLLKWRPKGLGAPAFAAVLALCSWGWFFSAEHPGKRLLGYPEFALFADGPESTVAVTRDKSGHLTLFVDWWPQAATGARDIVHLKLLGHIPALLHPKPRRGLVVGLGAGGSAGALTRHPFDEITIVELSKDVLRAAPLFAPYNHAPLEDPRVQVIRGDGRNHLRTTAQRYDVITTDPINPEMAGAGALYSKEYYELVRSRLTENGVACQWLPAYYRPDVYRMLVKTFVEVFPDASLWYAESTTILIGLKGGPGVSLADLRRRLEEPRLKESLSILGLTDAESFAGLLISGAPQTIQVAGAAAVTSDDRPLIEFQGGLDHDPDSDVPPIWEDLADLRPADFASVFAGWSAEDRRRVRPSEEALDWLYARQMRVGERPPREGDYRLKAGRMEAASARYLDLTWRILAGPFPPLYRSMIGLHSDETDRVYLRELEQALSSWRAGRWREAEARLTELAIRYPRGRRAQLLTAAAREKQGDLGGALEALLMTDVSTVELRYLPHRMVDRVLSRMSEEKRAAPSLGKVLGRRIPAERNRPSGADAELWRSWWSEARFDLEAGPGRFVWRR